MLLDLFARAPIRRSYDRPNRSKQALGRWATAFAALVFAGCGSGSSTNSVGPGTGGGGGPTAQFRAASSQGLESDAETIEVFVDLSPAAATDLRVPLTALLTGGAKEGEPDFELSSDQLEDGELLIPAGQTEVLLRLQVADDDYFEADEVLRLDLGSPGDAARLGERVRYEHTIRNDDPAPEVSFSVATLEVGESNGSTELSLVLDPEPGRSMQIAFVIDEDGTSGDVDFSVATEVAIPAHTAQATLQFTPRNDSDAETDESVLVRIVETSEVRLGGTPSIELTIVDDDNVAAPVSVVVLGAHTTSTNEDDVTLRVPVVLSAPRTSAVSLPFSVGGTAGAGADFELLTPSPIVLGAGLTTTDIEVRVLEDLLHEASETVALQLLAPPDPQSVQLGAPGETSTQLTILDDDTPPSVAFVGGDIEVLESVGIAFLDVELSGGLVAGRDTTVEIGATALTATSGDDFVVANTSLLIAKGESSASAAITIVQDALDETLLETLRVDLVSADHASLGSPSSLDVTIRDDDAKPQLEFALLGSAELNEASGTLEVEARLSVVSGRDVEFSLVFDGQAESDEFTLLTPLPITILAGETTASFEVQGSDDDIFEGDESLNVGFDSVVNANAGDDVALTIVDDESAPTVSLDLAPTLQLVESSGDRVVDVQLSHPSAFVTSVQIDHGGLPGDSAESPDDYTVSTASLQFNANTLTQSFTIGIVDDAIFEADEAFKVELTSPVGASLGQPSSVAVTILDNEAPPPIADGDFELLAPDVAPGGAWEILAGANHTVRNTGERLFWADTPTDALWHSTPDGADVVEIELIARPLSVAVDSDARLIFWTSVEALGQEGLLNVYRVDTDDFVFDIAPTLVEPKGLAVDPVAEHIYVADNNGIVRFDYDGSNQTPIVTDVQPFTPTDIVVDPEHGKIYWSTRTTAASPGGPHGVIRRANLNGTSVEDVATSVSGTFTNELAIDLNENKLYWAARKNLPSPIPDSGRIERTNLDGSGRELLLETDLGAHGIAFDPLRRDIFWSQATGNPGNSSMHRASVDDLEPSVLLPGLIDTRSVGLLGPSAGPSAVGIPTSGIQWCELEARSGSCDPAGIRQSFGVPSGQALLGIDFAVLAHADTDNGQLTITLSDGNSDRVLVSRDIVHGDLTTPSQLHPDYLLSSVENVVVNIDDPSLFPNFDPLALFTLTIEVASCPSGEPAKAYIDRVRHELGNEEPIASFSAVPNGGVAPVTLTFSDTSTGSITDWAWDVDGNLQASTGTEMVFEFEEADVGQHLVTLTVSGPAGSDSASQGIEVVEQLVADFTATPANPVVGEAVILENKTTGFGQGSEYAVHWNFGDLTESDLFEPPPHAYSTAGTKTVVLTVTGPFGLASVASVDIEVAPAPEPIAAFSVTVPPGQAPITVTFKNESQHHMGSLWDFDDGSVLSPINDEEFTHTYFVPGVYFPKLQVTGFGGTSDPVEGKVIAEGPAIPFGSIYPIFQDCTGCHDNATPSGNLPLGTVGVAYDALMGDASPPQTVAANCGGGELLVTPFDPTESVFMEKIENEPAFNGASVGQQEGGWTWNGLSWVWTGCGSNSMSDFVVLDQADIDAVADWILGGAIE